VFASRRLIIRLARGSSKDSSPVDSTVFVTSDPKARFEVLKMDRLAMPIPKRQHTSFWCFEGWGGRIVQLLLSIYSIMTQELLEISKSK